jgi:DNA-binding LacI/PurR family transcriptional regulator
LVVVDKTWPYAAVSSVSSDNEAAGKMATEYLMDLGHEAIAFLSPEVDQTDTLEARVRGYTQAHWERGLAVDLSCIFDQLPSDLPVAPNSGFTEVDKQQVKQFLDAHPTVTAAVAAEYATGMLLLEVLSDTGRRCPDDLSIVVFDGPSTRARWQFTRVIQDERGMGLQAAQLLVEQMRGQYAVKKIQLPTQIVAGDSTRRRQGEAMHA